MNFVSENEMNKCNLQGCSADSDGANFDLCNKGLVCTLPLSHRLCVHTPLITQVMCPHSPYHTSHVCTLPLSHCVITDLCDKGRHSV